MHIFICVVCGCQRITFDHGVWEWNTEGLHSKHIDPLSQLVDPILSSVFVCLGSVIFLKLIYMCGDM